MGIYVDCDVYCVKPFSDRDYIFSWECNSQINNAIIKFPQKSELLNSILEASENPYFIPPWLPPLERFRSHLRRAVGRGKHISRQPWGVVGPRLLTYQVKRLNLSQHAVPIHRYSPMYASVSNMLFEEGLTVSDLVAAKTEGIHLYHFGLPKREVKPNTPMYEIINS